jgi:large subunit ribosomal protein L4
MKLKVYSVDGKDSGRSVTLDKALVSAEPNDHAIWLDVRRIQANKRQGTHKAKERSEVAGSTRKLYRQKGTGNARAGDAKSPTRRSGGTIFGPRPRDYGFKVNRKTQRLARRSVVAYKAAQKAVRVVEDFGYENPDTNEIRTLLQAHKLGETKVLLLTAGNKPELHLSGRNLKKLTVRNAVDASTLDLIDAAVIFVQEGAVEDFQKALLP